MKKKIKSSWLQGFKATAAAALISLSGITNVQAQDTKGQAVVSSVTVTATVLMVNQKTREVSVKTEDGHEYSFIAGEAVKNLAQVKKGDVITAVYTESLAYEVKKHGQPGVTSTQATESAAPGTQPKGAIAQQTTVTVTITAIDRNIPSVTFKGPKGNERTIKVRDPQKLNGVNIGDLVDITYTEALAIKVDDPSAKK